MGLSIFATLTSGVERGYTNWRAACRKLMLILDRVGLRTLLLSHELCKFHGIACGFWAELGSRHVKRASIWRVFAITAPCSLCLAALGRLHNLNGEITVRFTACAPQPEIHESADASELCMLMPRTCTIRACKRASCIARAAHVCKSTCSSHAPHMFLT